MEIVVCPLHLAPQIAKEKRVSHAISLLDPANPFPSLHPLTDAAHLKIGVHDIDELMHGYAAPDAHHVESLLAFAEGWDRAAPMLAFGLLQRAAFASRNLCRFWQDLIASFA